ncbi:hypothetical protein STTU_4808 [Streptomyces sp. Tu6071]|nr:hypothetical protein STTU_4808 [Streptomyces sp. Tu6071]
MSNRRARTVRCRAPPIGTARPSTVTESGPKTRNLSLSPTGCSPFIHRLFRSAGPTLPEHSTLPGVDFKPPRPPPRPSRAELPGPLRLPTTRNTDWRDPAQRFPVDSPSPRNHPLQPPPTPPPRPKKAP